MTLELRLGHHRTAHHRQQLHHVPTPGIISCSISAPGFPFVKSKVASLRQPTVPLRCKKLRSSVAVVKPRFRSVKASPDLTEENVKQVLNNARVELAQLFDSSVGMTGIAELAEIDGPFVKISLKGRFWHKRSVVLARLGNYLKQRIPEILEVEIEDERQLDDSPKNF